jgi:hypothetical protein
LTISDDIINYPGCQSRLFRALAEIPAFVQGLYPAPWINWATAGINKENKNFPGIFS